MAPMHSLFKPLIALFSLFSCVFHLSIVFSDVSKRSSHVIVLIFWMIFEDLESYRIHLDQLS